MRSISATLLLMFLCCLFATGQNSTNPPTTSNPPGSGNPPNNDSSSRQAQPPSVPLPDDSPMPDLGTLPQTQDKKQSAVKRKLKELDPHCLNIFLFHTCWSQPPAPETKTSPQSKDDPEFTKDMEVGDFYLNERKNYKGAELRFRDALEHKPNDPLATFRLAQSLEGLSQFEEARKTYETYLKLEPNGHFVEQANKALERLESKTASDKKPK